MATTRFQERDVSLLHYAPESLCGHPPDVCSDGVWRIKWLISLRIGKVRSSRKYPHLQLWFANVFAFPCVLGGVRMFMTLWVLGARHHECI